MQPPEENQPNESVTCSSSIQLASASCQLLAITWNTTYAFAQQLIVSRWSMEQQRAFGAHRRRRTLLLQRESYECSMHFSSACTTQPGSPTVFPLQSKLRIGRYCGTTVAYVTMLPVVSCELRCSRFSVAYNYTGGKLRKLLIQPNMLHRQCSLRTS